MSGHTLARLVWVFWEMLGFAFGTLLGAYIAMIGSGVLHSMVPLGEPMSFQYAVIISAFIKVALDRWDEATWRGAA